MKELRVDIGGSTRGFQIATEETKRMARDLQKAMDSYTPQTFKNAQAVRDRYGTRFEGEKEAATGIMSRLKGSLGGIREHLGGELATVGAGIIGVEAIRQTIEFGGQVNDLSEKLGISTDAVQRWNYALKMTGSSMEALTPFFSKLAQNRDKALGGGSGADEVIANFKKLGVTIGDLKNKRLEDIGTQIADSVKGQDLQQVIGTLKEIGGKGAVEMVAAFKEGITDLGNEAAAAGAIMSEEAIKKMDEMGDKMSQLGLTLKAGMAYILSPIVDGLMSIIHAIERVSAFAGGFSSGGMKGGIQAVRAYDEEQKANEEKSKNRGKNRAEAYKADGADEAKAHKAAEKAAKEKAEAQKEYRRALEESVPYAQKLKMIEEDENAIRLAILRAKAAKDETSELKLKAELLKKQNEYRDTAEALAKSDKEGLAKKQSGHIDSLSGMGLIQSSGALSNPMLDVNRKQLEKLVTIAENTKPKPDPFAP